MRLYGQITKLEPHDDGTVKVTGVASSGATDSADERVSPAAMKAALPDYMRFGALREMHGMSAAGATLGAGVGEDGLTRIEAHVVDPLAVKKVKLGVYKGFSIGGRVTARDPDDPKLITGLRLDEISLVDRPCNPEAVIEMWKADAARPPAGPTIAPTNADVIAKAAEMAAAAGRPGRQADYVLKARQLLTQAAVSHPDPSAALDEAELTVKRGARNSAADLARIQAAHDELVALGARCAAAHDEDDADLDDDDADDDDDFDGDTDDAGADDDDPADKAARASLTRLAAAPGHDAHLHQQIHRLGQTVAVLQKRLDQLAAQPLPPRTLAGLARAVTKAEDAGAGAATVSPEDLRKYLDGLSPEERGRLELRAALSRPISVGR